MAELKRFDLPDVGEGLTEAEIVNWHVRPGDPVRVNQTIVEIETAKASVELPSPYDGLVGELLVQVGETVEVGAGLITIDTSGAAGRPGGETSAGGERAEDAGPAGESGDRESVLVGYGPRNRSARRRPRKGRDAPGAGTGPTGADAAATGAPQASTAFERGARPTPSTEGTPSGEGAGPAGSSESAEGGEPADPASAWGGVGSARDRESWPPQERQDRVSVLAKPPVRKLAKDLGVDLREVSPSGPDGTVTRADVAAAAGLADRAGSAGPVGPAGPGGSRPDAATGLQSGTSREQRIPIKGVRKRTAAAMVSSAFTAPHVTEFLTVDVTPTVRAVEHIQQVPDYADVRVRPLLLAAKALLLAVRRHPLINSSWDEQAQEIVVKEYVNLGIAVASSRGLVVPNIKGAESMSLPQLAYALRDLVSAARAGETTPADMQGGTITLTNVGVYGVDAGTPILNPGEAAILALGAIREQPWVYRGELAVRQVVQLSLSFDHRIVDGELGSKFLADIGAMLSDPTAMLAWS